MAMVGRRRRGWHCLAENTWTEIWFREDDGVFECTLATGRGPHGQVPGQFVMVVYSRARIIDIALVRSDLACCPANFDDRIPMYV